MACDKENGVGLFFWLLLFCCLFQRLACLFVGVGVRDSSLRGAGSFASGSTYRGLHVEMVCMAGLGWIAGVELLASRIGKSARFTTVLRDRHSLVDF
jgi:hypothetical protein